MFQNVFFFFIRLFIVTQSTQSFRQHTFLMNTILFTLNRKQFLILQCKYMIQNCERGWWSKNGPKKVYMSIERKRTSMKSSNHRFFIFRPFIEFKRIQIRSVHSIGLIGGLKMVQRSIKSPKHRFLIFRAFIEI